ncbi:MAG: ORF6N domain-containing protein [Candidatus Vogelbacteria bacterium]|nr:ORF6N domain-containing protein [Candidatus Vogelbacteria bacterium]
MLQLLPVERIAKQIFLLRGRKVMLDRDLAELYGVETKALNQAVSRNKERFPADFMFQLSRTESESLRSQIVTLEMRSQFVTASKRNIRFTPYAFTEHGVAMLSSVLKSKRAIQVNIQIIRTFTQMREMLMHYRDLKEKIEAMEAKYDKNFRVVFETLQRLLHEEENPKPPISFR